MIALSTHYLGNMLFEAMDDEGHKLRMDTLPAAGGQNSAISPKKLLLAGLLGCTGMDVVSILKKMQVSYESFDMTVEATTQDTDPKIFNHIKMTYLFKGKDIPLDKVKKAISLSYEKYCAVGAMLKKVCPVEYDILIE